MRALHPAKGELTKFVRQIGLGLAAMAAGLTVWNGCILPSGRAAANAVFSPLHAENRMQDSITSAHYYEFMDYQRVSAMKDSLLLEKINRVDQKLNIIIHFVRR